MFRVQGRDAQGSRCELSVNASTEEQARLLAQEAGLVSIERVSIPPATQASWRLSGFAIGVLGCLGCLSSIVAGAVIGAIAGHEAEPPGHLLNTQWLTGGVVARALALSSDSVCCSPAIEKPASEDELAVIS